MNREQRRALLRAGYRDLSDPSTVVAALERRGGILWEQGREGIEGWAICPCCGERQLHVVVDKDSS